ncbi:AraC family transcriptional regulator [Chryseobacterium chendengshani]|uniref:helix-turn-helix transcriptional regulator n=1 Tax=Chryseobacterium sp. LJ668 TaxID=2864040 RepID=UPI001C6924D1|nr:AraC family transcriptional regulator [Chryseobacterium sp. LJ668]MBW8523513.1 AraC family transcriptional regulator [Chryseobacterium sp. LJ668]QYK15796.1 AraC family transcriptional regulator [Chryseobacterium sp. LJ668]
MKISVTDKHGSGIIKEFAAALGTKMTGHYLYIPKNKGEGFITGFSWNDNQLRMMLRNYHLNEEIVLERTNEFAEDQDDIIFILNGIFPKPLSNEKILFAEKPGVTICRQSVTSVVEMPSNTFFRSIVIAVSKKHLHQLFGNVDHPLVESILNANDNFAFDTILTAEMIKTAGELLNTFIPESIESRFSKLKCEELLCYIFGLLVQRDSFPTSTLHIADIKSIYAIKLQLQNNLDGAPNISLLAKEAGMSEPKMRKIFKQTFGKGVFEYFQSNRMNEAARLLREQHLTVSEVGYQLGFTNLSHFSRVFEEHIGMKPKKYSSNNAL